MIEIMLNISKESNLKKADLGSGVEKIVNGLFPSLYIFIATIGSFIITFIILTFFLYKPITKMMKKRHDFIQKNIDDSIFAKSESKKFKSESDEKLKESKLMAHEIILKSKKESEILKMHYINEGKKEAERLISQANIEIAFKLIKIEETRSEDIINTALIISKQIIKQNIDKNKIKEYFDSYIKGE